MAAFIGRSYHRKYCDRIAFRKLKRSVSKAAATAARSARSDVHLLWPVRWHTFPDESPEKVQFGASKRLFSIDRHAITNPAKIERKKNEEPTGEIISEQTDTHCDNQNVRDWQLTEKGGGGTHTLFMQNDGRTVRLPLLLSLHALRYNQSAVAN